MSPDALVESPDGPGRTKRVSHVLTPLRTLTGIAPSGAEITFIKFTESDRELSWYQGNLTAEETAVFWQAKLKAERSGAESWDRARQILMGSDWRVLE